MNDGKWVTLKDGRRVYISTNKYMNDKIRKGKLKDREAKVVYRAGTETGKMDSGTFFAVDESEANNYGKAEKYEFDKTINLFKGESSQEYARATDIMTQRDNNLREKLGVDTLEEVERIHQDWITPSYLDTNPNLYFYAYQYMAKKDLEKKGYDGAYWKWEDDLTPEQYQIWNETKFKKIK